MASSSGVSWRRLVNVEHPALDLNLHGFCNTLGAFAIESWIAAPSLRSLPLAVCGLFWPHSTTARIVTGWIQTASLTAWFGAMTWHGSRKLIHFGDDIFENLDHGRWIHPAIPVSLMCTLNAAMCCWAHSLEFTALRTTLLGGLQFRGRAWFLLGCVSVMALFTLPFVPDKMYDPRNTCGRLLSDLIRRCILGPLLRRNKRRREVLSTTFLGLGHQGTPFAYPPLRFSKSIRLLELVRDSQKSATVSADLIDFELSSAPAFEAMSYRWGDPARTHHIRIGHTLPRCLQITKSAHDALRAITPLRGIKYVWIDSVCINQDAASEKQQQLPMMGEIYEEASLVTAHIPDPEAGDALYASLCVTCLAWTYFSVPTLEGPELNLWHGVQSLLLSPEKLPFPPHDPAWHSLTNLVQNPIWARAWITQETTLARRWRLLYGEACMGLGALFAATTVYSAWEAGTAATTPQDLARVRKGQITTCTRSVLHRLEPSRPSLVENIVTDLDTEATFPEDKVYALLGISSGPVALSLRRKLKQDGFMTPRQLYTYIVRQDLDTGSFLTFSMSGASQLPSIDIPSWAPDLSSASSLLATPDYHRDRFSAGSSVEADYDFSLDGNELRMRGVLLDYVHSCSPAAPGAANVLSNRLTVESMLSSIDITKSDYLSSMHQRVSAAVNLVRQHIPDVYMGDMDPFEALCRTILQDCDPTTLGVLDEQALAVAAKVVADLASMAAEAPQCVDDPEDFQDSMLNPQLGDHTRLFPEVKGKQAHYSILFSVFLFRQVAITRKGYLASVPWGTKEGDVICIFQGSPAACVLRPIPQAGADCYTFYGETYVQGWMHGEAMGLEKTWFTMR